MPFIILLPSHICIEFKSIFIDMTSHIITQLKLIELGPFSEQFLNGQKIDLCMFDCFSLYEGAKYCKHFLGYFQTFVFHQQNTPKTKHGLFESETRVLI